MKTAAFRVRRLCAALAAAALLLSASACGEGAPPPGDTDAPGAPSPSEGPAANYPSRDTAQIVGTEAGLPVSYTIEPPSHSLRAGKLICSFRNIRLTDSMEGLKLSCFRWDANIYFEGQNLKSPAFLAEDGEHFVPGVYLLLVDVTVKSDGAESCTRRDRDKWGNLLGEFDDPCLFRADDLLFIVDLAPELTSKGYFGAYSMDYYSGMGLRAEHPLMFRLEPGESVDMTVGFLVSDVRRGGDTYLDSLYLADGAVHEVKDTLLHLDLSGEEALRG